jgi:hypothetical protein
VHNDAAEDKLLEVGESDAAREGVRFKERLGSDVQPAQRDAAEELGRKWQRENGQWAVDEDEHFDALGGEELAPARRRAGRRWRLAARGGRSRRS